MRDIAHACEARASPARRENDFEQRLPSFRHGSFHESLTALKACNWTRGNSVGQKAVPGIHSAESADSVACTISVCALFSCSANFTASFPPLGTRSAHRAPAMRCLFGDLLPDYIHKTSAARKFPCRACKLKDYFRFLPCLTGADSSCGIVDLASTELAIVSPHPRLIQTQP